MQVVFDTGSSSLEFASTSLAVGELVKPVSDPRILQALFAGRLVHNRFSSIRRKVRLSLTVGRRVPSPLAPALGSIQS